MASCNRKAHCLIAEKSLAMPRHIIFFDTETTPEKLPDGSIRQTLKLGWVCYYRRAYGRHLERQQWHYFKDALSFWTFVYKNTERKRKLWVIARNIVFDFTIVDGWKYLRQVGFKLKFFHNSGLTSIISVRSKHGSIVFLDSMNWFVESLAKTGERIGLPKLTIDFDTCTEKELSDYCHRDVEIEIKNFIQFMRFLTEFSISRLCYTRGSTAMAAYLFRHYDTKIYIHNNEQAIEIERDSYRGGRCECFYLGVKNDDDYYIVDVNSLYPSVMRDNLFPYKYLKIVSGIEHDTLKDVLGNKAVIAKVLIETDEPVYAVRRDRTIFPVGCFWATLTTPELKYALSKGHIVEIKEAVFYEQTNLFRKYVECLYGLRQKFNAEGNAEYVELCKKLLNSLYGKFGQKADVWEKIGECQGERDRVEVCFMSSGGRARQIRYLLGEIWELTGQEECFNSFPAIASHVTAYGRMYLWRLMQDTGLENYYYCDTDSLIISKAGLCRLKTYMSNTLLGGLKIVEKTDSMTIRGLKDYSTRKKQVVKGIRKNAVEIRSGVYEQELWPSFKGLLRGGVTSGYTVKKQIKILQRKYTKGTVSPDGTVTPLVLDDSLLLPTLLY